MPTLYVLRNESRPTIRPPYDLTACSVKIYAHNLARFQPNVTCSTVQTLENWASGVSSCWVERRMNFPRYLQAFPHFYDSLLAPSFIPRPHNGCLMWATQISIPAAQLAAMKRIWEILPASRQRQSNGWWARWASALEYSTWPCRSYHPNCSISSHSSGSKGTDKLASRHYTLPDKAMIWEDPSPREFLCTYIANRVVPLQCSSSNSIQMLSPWLSISPTLLNGKPRRWVVR